MKPIKKNRCQGFRTTEEEKRLIVIAALTVKKSPAEFMRDSAIEKAKKVIGKPA